MALLEIQNLSVAFGRPSERTPAVDDVSFSVDRGKTFCLVGESGSGKSVTALSIARLLPCPPAHYAGGKILLEGQDVLSMASGPLRQIRGGMVSYIFQEPAVSLNPVMRVRDQIMESLKLHRPRAAHDSEVIRLLQYVGIAAPEQRLRDYPGQLSGGMQQRVMIAMALASAPKLLIADEPTTALDVTIQAQILDLLSDLKKSSDMSMLLITHNLGIVRQMADDAAVMYAGQILEIAPARELLENPRHPYTQGLIESMPRLSANAERLPAIPGQVPRMNALPGGCRLTPAVEKPGSPAAIRSLNCFPSAQLIACAAPFGMEAQTRLHRWDRIQIIESLMSLLEVQNLKVRYHVRDSANASGHNVVRAVDGVSFDLKAGETLGLVGESGCGKSTLGRALAGLIKPASGTIHFDGVDLTAAAGGRTRAQCKSIQMIFQDPYGSLNPRMTVEDIVGEGLDIHHLTPGKKDRHARIAELLHSVGLGGEHMARYPHEFSGGQRQRIGIARALAVEPRLLICDEPVSALDVSVQAQIINLLQDLSRKLDLACLFIAHDLAVVEHLCDRVLVMYLGRIMEMADAKTLIAQPLHPYTQALISAIPVLDPETQRKRIVLQGDVPSPLNPPAGCPFHPRCPMAVERCRMELPALRQLAPNHEVACHLAG